MLSSQELDELEEELVSVCRTAIGDDLRSVTFFTASENEQLYIRSDLEPDANTDPFVANERLGFTSQQAYDETELGEYQFTIRVFEWGCLTRTIVDDLGVFVTTDPLSLDEFTEVEASVRAVLKEFGERAG